MADRYATNQFYNFNNYEENRSTGDDPTTVGTDDNPAFIWPPGNQNNAVAGKKIPVQRGYMRMITEGYGNNPAAKKLMQRRFHFQFNPDVLMRQVESTQGTQYWMNQDPAQFINPIPGNANFAFEFMLNREAEVANRKYRRGYNGDVINAKNANTTLPGDSLISETTDPNSKTAISSGSYNQESVVDLGVLADLFVFDQIIGQGMNAAVLDMFKTKTGTLVDAYNAEITANSNKDQTADEQDKSTAPTTISTEQVSKLNQFLTGNISNSAFLVSQPVRIVFSSLFMVEGFISGTTVVFNKFNPAMVPTQCTVSVQMQAMYIGFATKNTFLTSTLRDAFTETTKVLDKNDEAVAEQTSLMILSETLFKSIQDGVGDRGYSDNDTSLFVRDLLNKNGDDGTTKLRIQVNATDSLRSYIKNGYVQEIRGQIDLTLVYLGVNGVKSPNTDYNLGEEVYSVQSSYETVKNDSDESARPTFLFDRKVSTGTMLIDKNDNAQYQITATLSFTMVTNVQDITCKQIATVKKVFKYNEGISGADFTLNKITDYGNR